MRSSIVFKARERAPGGLASLCGSRGVPLRCAYCDTEYAFYDGAFMELEEIVADVKQRLGPPRKGPMRLSWSLRVANRSPFKARQNY